MILLVFIYLVDDYEIIRLQSFLIQKVVLYNKETGYRQAIYSIIATTILYKTSIQSNLHLTEKLNNKVNRLIAGKLLERNFKSLPLNK